MIYILIIVSTIFFVTMFKLVNLYSEINRRIKQLEKNNKLLKEKIKKLSSNKSKGVSKKEKRKNKSKDKKEKSVQPEPPSAILWQEGRDVKSVDDIKRENKN